MPPSGTHNVFSKGVSFITFLPISMTSPVVMGQIFEAAQFITSNFGSSLSLIINNRKLYFILYTRFDITIL